MSKLLFYYFGDDEAYFRALQGEFKKHAKADIDFQRVYESKDIKIQSLFLTVFSLKPTCVFIDFSKNTQDYLHLARIISRTSLEHEMLLVGLVDYLSPPEVMEESLATGARLNFIKSAETFDVAFGVANLCIPDSNIQHGFANASLKEEVETGILCKVGFVRREGIHIETDHSLSVGDRVVVKHHWLDKRLVPSKQMFVKEVSSSNMFYQFKNNAELDFQFVDEFVPVAGMDDETIRTKKVEREDLVAYHKNKLKKWMDVSATDGSEKRAKVLVVDYQFHFYQDQPRTDKHAFTIRCIPFLRDIRSELDRLKPQIVAFHIDQEHNTLESLQQLVGACDPGTFIIVFNSPVRSLELQQSTGYQQVIAYSEELSPEILLKMAEALQKKLTSSGAVANSGPKVFLKKTHPSSLAAIMKSVTVLKLSESDMIIQSDFPFAAGTNLHFTKPVTMVVNIKPVEKPSGKIPEFYGVIHSLGEVEKKELRRYVNSIFFRDHDAQVHAENDEFKKLNELKLQERVDQEAKLQAAAAAAEASPEANKDPEKEVG
jgi:hypothetical protein